MIVVFDGVCNLCNGWVRFVSKRDRSESIRFASIQSPAGEALLARHGYRAADLDTLLVIDNGALWVKTEAIGRVLAHLGGPWRVLALAARVVPRGLRDWLYTHVATNRYALFGRRAQCEIPSSALASRFLRDADDLPA